MKITQVKHIVRTSALQDDDTEIEIKDADCNRYFRKSGAG
jgi:hypothetical protein